MVGLRRSRSLSREWAKPLVMVQVNLAQTFDRVKRSKVLSALAALQIPLQVIATVATSHRNGGGD
eukprot:12823324-Prorocentrum_lima.AAC.1